MRLRAASFLLLLAAGCRAPAPGPKDLPFDFAARPGPTPAEFSQEAGLLTAWAGPLKQAWLDAGTSSLPGVDGVTIPYVIFRAASPKAAVVIVPGRTEALIKYAEVAQDLANHGYTSYLVELRGQGEAGRMLPDREKGYVVAFDDYVQDVHTFIQEVVKADTTLPVLLLAHSLGGGVATLLVDAYPGDVRALALSSPMLDVNTGGFPPAIASSLALAACSATDGTAYALGMGPYVEETDPALSTVTHSVARWTWKVSQLQADASIRLGGVTWRWLCQSLVASSKAQAVGAFNPLPTLLLQAGKDSVVNLPGEDRYCADAPHCTLSRLDDAFHEILQERDDLRNLAMSRVVKFFDAQVTP